MSMLTSARFWLHLPVGLINAFAFYMSWYWGFALLIGFLVYELNQDKWKRDKAFKDIVGWLVGLNIYVVIWVLFHWEIAWVVL